MSKEFRNLSQKEELVLLSIRYEPLYKGQIVDRISSCGWDFHDFSIHVVLKELEARGMIERWEPKDKGESWNRQGHPPKFNQITTEGIAELEKIKNIRQQLGGDYVT